MTEKPSILYNEAKIEDGSSVVTSPPDPNSDYDHAAPAPKTWTNNVGVTYTNAEFRGKYQISETPTPPDPSGNNHYVLDWNSGIISGSILFQLYRGMAIYQMYGGNLVLTVTVSHSPLWR